MVQKEYKIGIVGGTSLLAEYLIKYLIRHPFVKLTYIDSEHNPGEPICKFHNILDPVIMNKKLDKYSPEFIKKNLDLVFIAKPHTEAMQYVKELFNEKLKIIDLSGDFRIKNVVEYEKYYKFKHNAKELIAKSVYGLTEIRKEQIKKSLLVANPGCYPAGIILPLYPLIKNNIILLNSIFINSYSGISGAGKNPVPGKNLFLDAFNNIMAYKILDHQHTPEIEEQLSLNNENVKVTFVPHLTSIENGIFNTMFLKMKKNYKKEDLLSLYKTFYKDSKFIKIFSDKSPEIKNVVDTNYCIIYPAVNERTNTLIIISVIDNRIKGGAGQAIQNMNVMLEINEDTGLN